jgi:hypothetical protein
MNIRENSFIKGEDLMTRHIAGETLIVPVRGQVGDLNAIYTLNEVGSRIWQMIDAPTPVARIVEAITAEYDVTAEEALTDVIELLGSMEAAGLIRPAVESGT